MSTTVTPSNVNTGSEDSSSSVMSVIMSTTVTPASVSDSAETSSEDSSSSVIGVVAGCIVGVVVSIAIIALVLAIVWYERRKSKDKDTQGNYGSVCKVCVS